MKLDLGCGENKHEGYIGVDKEDFDGVDIIHDLNDFPWPFDDDSAKSFVTMCSNIWNPLGGP